MEEMFVLCQKIRLAFLFFLSVLSHFESFETKFPKNMCVCEPLYDILSTFSQKHSTDFKNFEAI